MNSNLTLISLNPSNSKENNMKYRNSLSLLAIAGTMAMLPATVRAHGDEKHEGKAAKDTLTGEVVDLACFMAHDGQGKDHMKCAKQCIQKGLPVGILTDKGEVYLAVGENHKNANEMLADKAAQSVTVVGDISEKAGTKMITIHELLKK
jgi:hypothetical protein